MGRSDLRAKIRLEGDAKGANKAIKSTETRFQKLGKTIKTSALAQVAAVAGIAVALRGLVRGIGSAISAANKQAEAINALEGALAPLGDRVNEVSVALQAQAAALQKVTTFGDETIIQAQAMIASFVKDEDAIKAATAATLDLAEAKGFDLVAAADLVSKTLGSSTNALTRYGIEVTGAVGSTERLTTLTENISTVFGGRAAKATETFSGKTKQLGNAWGDLAEKVGEAITNNEDASQSIDDLTKSVNEIAPAVATFAVGALKVATAVGKAAAAVFEFQAKIQTFIPNLIRTKVAAADSAVSMDAMERTAKELGISVEELKTRMDAGIDANQKYGKSMVEAAEATEKLTAAQETAEQRTKRIEDGILAEATALDALAAALGEVTQAELQKEIADIAAALEEARESTDASSDAFARYEQIATEKIHGIQARLQGLRDGLGDVGEASDKAGESFEDMAGSMDQAAASTGLVEVSTRKNTAALIESASQARITATEYTALSAVAESLALAQARTALRQAQRARGVGRSGGGFTDYNLSPFGTGGRYRLDANGNLVPA